MTTTRLPVVLESIRIATPCKADWDEMAGSDQVRFCGRCEKNVYNLSAMSRDEAETLVREKEGRMCVRLYQRSDGTVLTADCPVGVQRARLRHRVWARISSMTASAALVLGLFGGRARADLAVNDGKTDGKKVTTPAPVPSAVQGGMRAPEPMIMGKIAAPKPPEKKATKKPKVVVEPPAVMGEPARPMMGDVAVAEPAPKAAVKK